jgi:hypothetical protein
MHPFFRMIIIVRFCVEVFNLYYAIIIIANEDCIVTVGGERDIVPDDSPEWARFSVIWSPVNLKMPMLTPRGSFTVRRWPSLVGLVVVP